MTDTPARVPQSAVEALIAELREDARKFNEVFPDRVALSERAAEALASLRAAPDVGEMLEALELVRGIIAEGAATGFNCHSGDWAERLFRSQWDTHQALSAWKAAKGEEKAG